MAGGRRRIREQPAAASQALESSPLRAAGGGRSRDRRAKRFASGTVVLWLVLAAFVTARSASAESAPLVAIPNLPWSDPQHEHPLELLAGRIASEIADHAVSVRCEGDSDWHALAAQRGFPPSRVFGYVAIDSGTPSSFAELSPYACWNLWQFATATTKPTRHGPSAAGYFDYAAAILTLAHESIHLAGVLNEAVTECYAMQLMPLVATQLGAGADDATALARWWYATIYPTRRISTPSYWSSDCVPGGRLDLERHPSIWAPTAPATGQPPAHTSPAAGR
jgi:hypothetical protein